MRNSERVFRSDNGFDQQNYEILEGWFEAFGTDQLVLSWFIHEPINLPISSTLNSVALEN
jgi:hypothetical protein